MTRKELTEKQRQATLLINPVPPTEEFTKYFDDIIYDGNAAKSDASAEDVFTKNFEAFDFEGICCE